MLNYIFGGKYQNVQCRIFLSFHVFLLTGHADERNFSRCIYYAEEDLSTMLLETKLLFVSKLFLYFVCYDLAKTNAGKASKRYIVFSNWCKWPPKMLVILRLALQYDKFGVSDITIIIQFNLRIYFCDKFISWKHYLQ